MKENFYSNKSKVRYNEMVRGGRPVRNSRGEIVKPADFQSTEKRVGKIHSDRKWFKPTRMITPEELEKLKQVTLSPYEVLLKKGKLPFNLDASTKKKMVKADFQKVFGKKATRKRPTMVAGSLEDLKQRVGEMKSPVDVPTDGILHSTVSACLDDNVAQDCVRGQSKRIWNELYKVIDCSDVIVHVLDGRDPVGTHCASIEKYIREKAPFKHLIYVLNKVDLVPMQVTARWLRVLSKRHPVLAYHSNSLANYYGKENLLNVLRQYSHLKQRRVSVGFVGYPNVGKSSIINTLRRKAVCSVAPVPGQTKFYQYITLMKKIYLIDSPGVVPTSTIEEAVLRGAMRIENLEDPEYFFGKVYERASKALATVYGIESAECLDFLEKYCKKYGKILRGGVPNTALASKVLLHDWLRGRIPYYAEPPILEGDALVFDVQT